MQNAAWIVKHIVLPLAPFFIGGLIRIMYSGQPRLEAVSPGELTFSMAVLSLLMSSKTSQLANAHLRETLTSLFQFGVIVFLALFAWSVLVEVDIAYSLNAVLEVAVASEESGAPVNSGDLPKRLAWYNALLGRLRWAALLSFAVVVPMTLYAARKYGLQNL